MFSLVLETILILPITYKIFKLPYKNYLNYIYYKYKNSLENNVNYNITVSVKKLKTNGGEMFG